MLSKRAKTSEKRSHAPGYCALFCLFALLAPSLKAQDQNPSGLPGVNASEIEPQTPKKTIIASTAAPEQNPTGLPGQSGPNVQPAQTNTTTPPLTTPSSPPPQIPVSSAATGTGELQYFELHEFSNVTRVTGEARDRSFLTAGYNNALDFSLLQDFSHGVHRFELVSVGRYTDDPRVDPEHNSLQRAYFRITSPRSEINIGDYLVSYSRFTYNQNLKGLNFVWGAPSTASSGFRLFGNAGTFTDRYGSLWKDYLPGKPFTRIVSGVRAEERFTRDKLIAFNWAYGNDIVRSVPVDPFTGTQPFVPVQNDVASVESRMSFGRVWDMQAEGAYSLTNPDTRVDNFYRKDYAVRFDNAFRLGSWNITENFTRIMPSFYAVNARQVADLQDGMLRVSDQLSSRAMVQVSYRRTNDDLRDQNPNPRTVFQLPEARVSFRDLPGLGNVLLDFGYRERHQEQLGLASRVTRAPFMEVGIPISSSVLTFDFEHRANIDHLAATNQTSANDVSVSFRSIFNLGSWQFTPLLRYELNREIFDRVTTGNVNRSIQAGLIIDAPRYFVLEGMYREIGATLFEDLPQIDPATFQPVLGPNGQTLYSVAGPSGFRRPALHAAITYKFRNNENHTVALSYDNNKNWFALPGQNFFERVIQVTVVWRIRNQ